MSTNVGQGRRRLQVESYARSARDPPARGARHGEQYKYQGGALTSSRQAMSLDVTKRNGGRVRDLTNRLPFQEDQEPLGTTRRPRTPSTMSWSTQGSPKRSERRPASPCTTCSTRARSLSVVSTTDEMDPILPVLEHAKEITQQKYLHALEDSVTNVEFTAYLNVLNINKSKMSAVEDSCPEERESTASPPTTAHKRQRSARCLTRPTDAFRSSTSSANQWESASEIRRPARSS